MKIILLHGALGAAGQLMPLAGELEKEDFYPEIIELPGHGRTPADEADFSIDGFAGWLGEEISSRKLEDVPFFGFSMGGYIGLLLASLKKIPSKEIITLGTKFHWTTEVANEEVKRLDPEAILEKVPKFANMLDQRHSDWRAVLQNTKNLMQQLGEYPEFNRSEAEQVQNRVLIMRGDTDNMVGATESKEVAEWLPNGLYKELEGVPHPLEQVPANRVVKEIKDFLNNE